MQYDESSALRCVEDAGPVAELAPFIAQIAHLAIVQVENLNRGNGLGHFLSVGADILHGRAAYTAGNAAQAFDAGTANHHGARNEFVPGLSRAGIEKNLAVIVACGLLVDPLKRNFQHQARPPRVGDHQVAAAAQNEQRQVARARERNRLLHFADVAGLDEEPRRASYFDGGERRERNVFEQEHE